MRGEIRNLLTGRGSPDGDDLGGAAARLLGLSLNGTTLVERVVTVTTHVSAAISQSGTGEGSRSGKESTLHIDGKGEIKEGGSGTNSIAMNAR